jgi:hypothetical protein
MTTEDLIEILRQYPGMIVSVSDDFAYFEPSPSVHEITAFEAAESTAHKDSLRVEEGDKILVL